jgi:Uma2 family endonuclease
MVPEFGPTLATLLESLGDIPPWRVPLRPAPGTAKERDVLAWRKTSERWLCELAEGTIILKAPGLAQSVLSGALAHRVLSLDRQKEIGVGLPDSTMYRLKPGLVRIPDFAFLSWSRLPGGELPDVKIADLVPDLVVEVPREGNTQREMDRKVREYLDAGVRQVWLIQYPQRTAEVYADTAEPRRLGGEEALDGSEILPGLVVPLSSLFARLRRKGVPE